MNRLSRPTLDALVPLPIIEQLAASPAHTDFPTLTDLMLESQGIMIGRIMRTHLFRIERGAGYEEYFSTINLEGASLRFPDEGRPISLDLTFRSGSIRANQGTRDPSAPAKAEVKVGQEILVFYRWARDLGLGIRGYGLVGMRAGFFPARRHAGRVFVQGRGPGFAIQGKISLGELRDRIARIEAEHRGAKSSSQPAPTPRGPAI